MSAKLEFHCLGGPHDRQQLYVELPIAWNRKSVVLEGKGGTFHQYLFDKAQRQAFYQGLATPKQGTVLN